MSVPNFTLTCGIAFATTDPFALSPTYIDVHADVIDFSITRGRVHEQDRMVPGTATILLNNVSGNYWPNNTGGAYYPNILPDKRIRIWVTYGGNTYYIFEGMINAWRPDWIGDGGYGPVMYLDCSDVFAAFSKADKSPAQFSGYSAELSGARINHILDTIGWPAGLRSCQTGTQMIAAEPPATSPESFNPITHLYEVDEAERGFIFVGPNGYVYSYQRNALLSAPFNTSQVVFSDNPGAGEFYYTKPEFVFDDQYISNDIRVALLNSTSVHEAIDTTSINSYGYRVMEQQGSVLANESPDADILASYLQARFAQPHMRVSSLTLTGVTALTWPAAVQWDIPTRVTVKCSPASINEDYYIQGIKHDWDSRTGDWTTKLQLRTLENMYVVAASHTGDVHRDNYPGQETYTTTHNASVGLDYTGNPIVNNDGSDTGRTQADSYFVTQNGTGIAAFIGRAVYWFDLSGVPASVTIKSVELWYYCYNKFQNNAATCSLVLTGAIAANQPLVSSDYGYLRTNTTSYGSISNTNTTMGGWNRIVLNPTGQAYVYACTTGICPLGIRTDEDISATGPTDGLGHGQTIGGLGGTTPHVPYLIIVVQ